MSSRDMPSDGFAQVFLTFRARLARAVSRMVQPSDVEDIVQETFLRCYQASAKETIRHPRSFMLTTAKNLALNHLARADNRLVRGVDSFDDSTVPLYREEPAADAAERDEDVVRLCEAVRALPLQCQRAFILKKVYGLSRKEIASHMGITESTVQKHVAKGLLMCAEYLEGLDAPARGESNDRAQPTRLKRKRGL